MKKFHDKEHKKNMVTEENIVNEVKLLNEASSRLGRSYVYRKGNDGSFCLFNVEGDTYRPVWLCEDEISLFSYVSLLKNIYLRKGENDE
jgi:hypothetical protein